MTEGSKWAVFFCRFILDGLKEGLMAVLLGNIQSGPKTQKLGQVFDKVKVIERKAEVCGRCVKIIKERRDFLRFESDGHTTLQGFK